MKHCYYIQHCAVFILNISLVFAISACKIKDDNSISSRLHRTHGFFWPDGVLPFDINPYLSKEKVNTIRYAIDYLNSVSCVKWVQRRPWETDDTITTYVTFRWVEDSKIDPICASNVGMFEGKQFIDLGDWCFRLMSTDNERKTALVHEMMHTMGFLHEHQRPDRDCYIVIDWWIQGSDFDKKERPDYDYDYPYDFKSIMNYVAKFIRPIKEFSGRAIGRLDGKLSPIDIINIEHLYCGEPSYCKRSMNMNECQRERDRKKQKKCEDNNIQQ